MEQKNELRIIDQKQIRRKDLLRKARRRSFIAESVRALSTKIQNNYLNVKINVFILKKRIHLLIVY